MNAANCRNLAVQRSMSTRARFAISNCGEPPSQDIAGAIRKTEI